ncbi:MAG TPA: hypothetical protein VFA50_11040 [Stellaceae bacterium]|nr:hypothetical protein [Stellaceae bacterium]
MIKQAIEDVRLMRSFTLLGIEMIVFGALCLLARDGIELQSLVNGLHKSVIEEPLGHHS